MEVKVKELEEVEMVRVWVVEDATRLVRSVEVATPFMVVVRVAPLVERALEEITEEVAVTPLMIVVSVLPERDCVKELMMVAREEEMPLMMVWKTLADDDAVVEVMIVDVPTDPPMLEVSVLPEEVRELFVRMLGAMREEMVVVARVVVPVVVREDAVVVARVEVPVTARVPLEVRELEKTASVARRSAVKKLPVEVALVKDAERAERRLDTVRELVVRTFVVKEDAVVVAKVVVPVKVLLPANVCVVVDTTPRAEAPAFGMLMV
jgi:hypothetical protein